MIKKISSFIFLSLGLSLLNAQITVVLQPGASQGKDSEVISHFPHANRGDSESLTPARWVGQGEVFLSRGLLEFDLSVIPENAVLESAYLSLYFNPTDPYEGCEFHTGQNDMVIERITTPWVENLVNWYGQPNTTSEDQLLLPASSSQTQDYLDMDVTAMVHDMLFSAEGNHGFMLRMADELDLFKIALFASSDHPDAALHPKLELSYSLIEPLACDMQKPNGLVGKDSRINSTIPFIGYGDIESISPTTWTYNGSRGNSRVLIEFDMTMVPENALITSASISLFYNPTDSYESWDVHTGQNEFYIERVTSSWNETEVNWSNQPSVSEVNRVEVPASLSNTQDYPDIDITGLARDIYNSTEGNNGFLIRMVDEVNFYKGVMLASSDHPNQALWPEFKICWVELPALPLGLDSQEDLSFQVFPNPNNGIFNIQYPDGNSNCIVEIFDEIGRRVQAMSNSDLSIELRDAGVYIIRISDQEGHYGLKRVVVE